jgi:hypothetical protein
MVWKIAKVGRVSAVTGEPFPADVPVVTALFGEEREASEDKVRGTGFVRRDFLRAEATPERLQGAYCVWHTRTAPAVPAHKKPLDLDLAREMLERLLRDADPAKAGVAMALALVLARKRRLTLLEQRPDSLLVRWPKEEASFEVPAPVLTEAETEQLEQELLRLFEL